MAKHSLSALGQGARDTLAPDSISTKTIERFRGDRLSALEHQLREEHRTGTLHVHYAQGSVPMVTWEEERK